jgi:hypothetical protein
LYFVRDLNCFAGFFAYRDKLWCLCAIFVHPLMEFHVMGSWRRHHEVDE